MIEEAKLSQMGSPKIFAIFSIMEAVRVVVTKVMSAVFVMLVIKQ